MALQYSYEIILALATCLIIFLMILLSTLSGPAPLNWPVTGMFPGIFLNYHRIHEYATDVLSLTGGTFYVKGPWFANLDMLFTVNPNDVHHVMSSNFANFPKGPEFAKIFEILGDGIFNSDSELWKNQRKLAQLLMNHQVFNRFLTKTSEDKVGKGLIPILNHVAKKGLVVDLQNLCKRFTFDATCILVTGQDPMSLSINLPDVPLSKAMDDAFEALLLRHIIPKRIWEVQRWLGIGNEAKLSQACAIFDHTIGRYISLKRDELRNGVGSQKEQEGGVDLLTSYLSGNEVIELKRDDKFLRDTIVNLLSAGRDTTSSALTWFLWLVSTHSEIQSKIRDELVASIPKSESPNWHLFKAEEVSKLIYLHSAICESLRLYPPVPFQHKEPLKPDVLPSGHRVNRKLKILFSLYAMGRMEFIWGKDCSEFKPERWISEQGKVKHEPSYKFLAFNAGPRTCLGKELAFAQIKVAAASIIHNYNLEVVKGHKVEPNASIILYMKHGLKVKVNRRWTD